MASHHKILLNIFLVIFLVAPLTAIASETGANENAGTRYYQDPVAAEENAHAQRVVFFIAIAVGIALPFFIFGKNGIDGEGFVAVGCATMMIVAAVGWILVALVYGHFF